MGVKICLVPRGTYIESVRNRMLKGVFGPKKEEVIGRWKKV
jgi:hypothetical protein